MDEHKAEKWLCVLISEVHHMPLANTQPKHTHIYPVLCRVLNVLSMNESVGANLEARLLCCLVFLVSLHGQHNLLLLSATAWESAEIGSTITHSFCTSLLILWISVCAKLQRRRCWEVYFWLLWWYNYAWHSRQLEEKTYACTSLP